MAAVCPGCDRELHEGTESCPHCADAAAAWRESVARAAPRAFGFELDEAPHGVGGWLVLVAIGLAIVPFSLANHAWVDFYFLMGHHRDLAGDMIPGLQAMIVFEMVINLALLGGSLVLNFLFYKEKRLLPRCLQVWLLVAAAGNVAEYCLIRFGMGNVTGLATTIVANMSDKAAEGAVESVITAIIWGTYFAVSRRVKATFVE